MSFRQFLKTNYVLLDGAMGTELKDRGFTEGPSEMATTVCPDTVISIHRDYFSNGANVVNTNTFGLSVFKYTEEEISVFAERSVDLAKAARDSSEGDQRKFIAFNIGPTGRMLKPFGDMSFEEAYENYRILAEAGNRAGVDLFTVETVTNLNEARAALLAIKEVSAAPVLISMVFDGLGKMLLGTDVRTAALTLEAMGADGVGLNCSLPPREVESAVMDFIDTLSIPTVVKPNSGLPTIVNGETHFHRDSGDFANVIESYLKKGARVVGGCCGTTPLHIKELRRKIDSLGAPTPIEIKEETVITSSISSLKFGGKTVVIGERINPTGKPKLKEAIKNGDFDYILSIAKEEEEEGADAIDVNVGLPGTDETKNLSLAARSLEYSTPLPLSFDSANPDALEEAIRKYPGRALINSVNGKASVMEKIFPLAKKYGGVCIALTLDENGIPKSAEERLEIAKRIVSEAKKYGIDKKDLVFDPLCMSVSADPYAAKTTLTALRLIKDELGCHTSLGVSNISFGLPERDMVNSAFLTMAIEAGLDGAIMNPASLMMKRALISSLALLGLDGGFRDYIEKAPTMAEIGDKAAGPLKKIDKGSDCETLALAIEKGLKEKAAALAADAIKSTRAMDIISEEIIPALNKIGEGFERGKVFLPELLLAADAASAASEVIKANTPRGNGERGKIVIATVKGDVHDIGKNIVKMLLENYGFTVNDLGNDVDSERILYAAKEMNADLVAISALMTTTVPSMEETIKLLRKELPEVKIMVGGAVLTEEYSKKIGADGYGKDAMGAVRVAEELIRPKQ